jgi:hypothetical protein
MKVKICKTGSVVHIPTNELSQILIESGLIAPVVEAPPAPGKAQWGAGPSPFTNELLITATCARCHQGTQIGGRTAYESKATFNHCGQAESIPPEIRQLGKQFVENQAARANANNASKQQRDEMSDAMPRRAAPRAILV